MFLTWYHIMTKYGGLKGTVHHVYLGNTYFYSYVSNPGLDFLFFTSLVLILIYIPIFGVLVYFQDYTLFLLKKKKLSSSGNKYTENYDLTNSNLSNVNESEKILDTTPINIRTTLAKFISNYNSAYILCFTNKNLILIKYPYKYRRGKLGATPSTQKKIKEFELQIKSYSGDLRNLLQKSEEYYILPYNNIEEFCLNSIFNIVIVLKDRFNPNVYLLSYAIDNRKYVKSLFRKYLDTKISE